MSEPIPKLRGPAFAVVLLLLTCACAPGGATTAARPSPTTDQPPVPAAQRTVVERSVGDALVRVVVVRSGDRAEASMEVVAPAEGPPTLIAEEIRIGHDHFVHLPEAAVVLGDDLWMRFDLTDDRHVRFLEEHPIGLFDQADRSDGSGVRVRRDRVSPPPEIDAPPADRIVAFEDIHELPGLALPMPG